MISLLFSIFYWFYSNLLKTLSGKLNVEDVDNNLKFALLVFKVPATFLLIDWLNFTRIDLVILLYSIGDGLIIYDERKSLYFFGMGHVIFLTFFDMIPVYNIVIALSTVIIYIMLDYDSLSHIIYIYILHWYLLNPIYDKNYLGTILLISSDILISKENKITQWLTWPLYYASLLYMRNYNLNIDQVS